MLYVPTDNTAANNTEVIANICVPAKVAGGGHLQGLRRCYPVDRYYDIGYKAGEMTYDIPVNGADITAMPIEYAPQVTREYNAEIL